MNGRSLRLEQAFFAALALVVACLARPVRARPDVSPGSAAGVALMTGATSLGEVGVRVETFGVGGVARAGDWAGIRLALKDSADRPRQAAVRLHLGDADGDTALHTRVITLNPGVEVGTWLYARMPWSLAPGSVLRVSVALAETLDDGGLRMGRQLTWAPIAAARAIPAEDALALVVGPSALALDQYARPMRDRSVPAGGHELMQVALGLVPETMPDAWTGLAAAEVMLWTSGDPSSLPGPAQAHAIREWVHRGGHLVVVIPSVGNPWAGAENPLADLLPSCRVDRLAEVDYSAYRTLLSGSIDASPKVTLPLHRFIIAEGTPPAEASPIVTGPHGVVVVRRLVGTGMVTLIGLDLANRRLAQDAWLRADALWSRILGRRAATPTQSEVEAALGTTGVARLSPEVSIDERLPRAISQSREAGLGMLLGFVVFAAYFGIAGPLGFAVLRARGWAQYSWLAFVGVAVLFTALTWIVAQTLRPKAERAWHFTLLDHVYGQPVQRARTFVSVLLPTYGDQRVTVGEAGTDERWSQALTPWADPLAESLPAFPDARSYTADVRAMTDLVVPARSTIKMFQVDWLGGPRWSMPKPADPAAPPRIDPTGQIVGVLTHDLPRSLRRPRVYLVQRQVAEGAVGRTSAAPAPLVARAFAWTAPVDWAPGAPLDLSTFRADPAADATRALKDLVPQVGYVDRSLPASVTDDDLDDAMAFYGVLEPPELDAKGLPGAAQPSNPRRRLVQTLDLAEWFTQPCLIIIGSIEGAPAPLPLAVDGLPLDGTERRCEGRTVVRWVYPLAPAPLTVGGGPGKPSMAPPPAS